MKSRNRRIASFAIFAVAFLMVVGLTVPLSGQEPQAGGLVNDWSHQHVVFSNPGAFTDAVRNGTAEQWLRINSDPRYKMQQLKRSSTQRELAAAPDFAARMAILNSSTVEPDARRRKPTGDDPVKKDWQTNLGSGATATQTGTFTGEPTAGNTEKITNGSNVLTLTVTQGTGGATGGDLTWGSTSSLATGNTVTIGSTTYVFVSGSNSGCATYPSDRCVQDTGTRSSTVTAFVNAVAGTCYATCPGGAGINDPAVTAANDANTDVYLYNTTAATIATFKGSVSNITANGVAGPTNSSILQSVTNSCSSTTTGTFILSPSTTNLATYLANAITACHTSFPAVGVTATPSGTGVTVTAATAGAAGNAIGLTNTLANFTWTGSATTLAGGANATVQPNAYPATYANNGTCSDFAVYPTGQAGSGTAANIIAYDNMYATTCSGVPTVYWAYNTGTGYSVTTSPILSVDGTKVAFIQSNGTNAQLVVVKWAPSTGTLAGPAAPTTGAPITTCTAPCMTVTALTNNDTYSSPFYDFLGDDALYVGDNSGDLEKFTGVFNGTSVTAVAPVVLGTTPVASPVYDYTSGCVFAGDTSGFLYRVSSGTALGGTGQPCTTGSTFATSSKVTSNLLATTASSNEGIFDAPLVDSTAGKVYVFITDSKTMTHTGTCTSPANCVAEFATNFTGATDPANVEQVGAGGAGYNLYSGAFDNVWFNSSVSTGNLYVVGNTAATAAGILYRVTLTAGSMANVASAVSGLNSVGNTWASPATEFCNGTCAASGGVTTSGTDYLFFSVNAGSASSCTHTAGNGCVLSYNINNPASLSLTGEQNYTNVGTNGCWVTGGLVIDNMAPATGASQIYFVALSGAAAGGGVGGGTPTSATCSAGTVPTIQATQAAQNNP